MNHFAIACFLKQKLKELASFIIVIILRFSISIVVVIVTVTAIATKVVTLHIVIVIRHTRLATTTAAFRLIT